MKFIVAIFALICAIQLAQSQGLDLQRCIDKFLEQADKALGKRDDYVEWRERLNGKIAGHNDAMEDCYNVVENDPPTIADTIRVRLCRLDTRRTFVADMNDMAGELRQMGGDAIEIAGNFPGEMLKCLGPEPLRIEF